MSQLIFINLPVTDLARSTVWMDPAAMAGGPPEHAT